MADSATRDKEMDESINLLRQNPQKYKEAFNSVYGEGSAESVFKAYGISETPQAATPVSTEPVEPVEPEDDGGSWYDTGDTIQGVFHGVAKAGEAIISLADTPAQWLSENIGTVSLFDSDGNFDPKVWSGEDVTKSIKEGTDWSFGNHASDFVGAPETVVGSGVSGITQFIVGFVGPGKFAKASTLIKNGTAKAAQKRGVSQEAADRLVRKKLRGVTAGQKIREGMVRGAIADFTAFEGSDGNLSNWLHGMGVDNAITEGLMTNPDDNEFINRAKTSLEGVVLGGVIEGVVYAFRAKSHLMKGNVEEANELADKAEKSLAKGALDENNASLARQQEALDATPTPKDEIPDNPDLEEITHRFDESGQGELIPETSGEKHARKLNEHKDMRDYDQSLRNPNSPHFKTTKELVSKVLEGSGIRMNMTGDDYVPGASQSDTAGTFQARERAAAEFSRSLRVVTDNDDIQDVLITVGEAFQTQYAKLAGGNVQRHSEVRQSINGHATTLAKIYKHSPKDLLDRFSQLSPNDYTKLAADLGAKGQFVDTMAKHIAEISKIYIRRAEGAIDDDKLKELGWDSADEFELDVAGMTELYANLEGIYRGQVKAVARALNAQKMVHKENVALNNSLIAKTGRSRSALLSYMRDVREAAEQGGHRNIPSASTLSTRYDRLNSLRINFMLSGPNTQIINTVSNFLNMNLLSIEQAVGGAVSGNRTEAMRGVRQLGATYGSMVEAIKMAGIAVREDRAVLDPLGKVEKSEHLDGIFGGEKVSFSSLAEFKRTSTRGKNWANLTTTLPSRLLLFSDEFFKQATYRGKLHADLWFEGQKQIADGKLTKEGLNEWIKTKSLEAFDPKTGAALATTKAGAALNKHSKAALDIAREATFTTELDGFFATVQAAAVKNPNVRFILPFIRTPTNLLLATYRRAPGVNLLRKHSKLRRDLRSDDPSIKAQARGKIMTGYAVTGVAGFLAYQGIITGSGPSNPKNKKDLIATGWRPYSIRVEDDDGTISYIPYQRYEPLSNFLGIAADVFELRKEALLEGKTGEEDRVSEILLGLATAVSENTINKTYMRGLSDFMTALISPERSLGTLASGVIKSFSPNIINQLNNDPYMRETRSMLDGLRSAWNAEIGGFVAPVKRNALGEPVMRMASKAHPFTASTRDKNDVVLEELSAMGRFTGKTFGLPTDRTMGTTTDFSQVLLSDGMSVYDTYLDNISTVEIGGQTLRERLERLIQSPSYQRLSVGTRDHKNSPRARVLSRMFSRYRDRAKKEMLREGRLSSAPEPLKQLYQEYRKFKRDTLESRRGSVPKTFTDLLGN